MKLLLRAWLLQLAAGLLMACGPQTLSSVHGSLAVDKAPIDFGSQPVLTPVTKKLVLTNAGRGVLHFTTPNPLQGNAAHAFSLPAGFALTQLGPSGHVELDLTFSGPALGPYTAQLVFASDDPSRGQVIIPIKGESTTSAAAVATPKCLDFGRVEQGQSSIKTVTLTSSGTAPLLVNRLAFTNGSCAAFGPVGSWRTDPPLQLNAHTATTADDSTEINVVFTPTLTTVPMNEMCTGTLEIGTNDPMNQTIPICLTGIMAKVPVAVPGPDQKVPPGSTVKLDGSMSYDPDGGTITKYAWSILSGPQGNNAATSWVPATADTAMVTFVPDQPGEYVVELVVTNNNGLSSVPARVKITGVLSNDLVVKLVWDSSVVDLDLHMRHETSPVPNLFANMDCWWSNPHPIWDLSLMNGPVHGGDILAGYGPEIITYENPPLNTSYRVTVVYANANGAPVPDVNATVRFYLYGVVVGEVTRKLTHPGTFPNDLGEAWDAAVVDWPSGLINISPPGGTL